MYQAWHKMYVIMILWSVADWPYNLPGKCLVAPPENKLWYHLRPYYTCIILVPPGLVCPGPKKGPSPPLLMG